LEDLFHLPLSHQAFLELNQFEELCNQTVLKINYGVVDTWSYIWGSSEFSVKNAFAVMSGHQHAPPIILLDLENLLSGEAQVFLMAFTS
jgi:hypothetical protein